MIVLWAFFASFARLLIFPVSDYPDACYIYPRALLSAFLTDKDYNLDLAINVVPADQTLSLLAGSIYSNGILALPSFRYWLVSSLPFLAFAIFSNIYIKFFASNSSRPILNKMLILFVVCPSSSYYLCTLHPEAWANAAALAYTVTALSWVASSIPQQSNFVQCLLPVNLRASTYILFSLVLIIGFFISRESQFILCFIGVSWLYFSIIYRKTMLIQAPSYLLLAVNKALSFRLVSIKKLMLVVLLVTSLALLVLFPYALRNLFLSIFLYVPEVSSAVSLYTEGSVYADKYPLLARPLLTLNNLFVYTPAGFGPSAILKIACLWLIFSAWFQATSLAYASKCNRLFLLLSSLKSCLLFPLPIICLLPGYVNLKYYLFFVPVALFVPSMRKYYPLMICFVMLWLELAIRAMLFLI